MLKDKKVRKFETNRPFELETFIIWEILFSLHLFCFLFDTFELFPQKQGYKKSS